MRYKSLAISCVVGLTLVSTSYGWHIFHHGRSHHFHHAQVVSGMGGGASSQGLFQFLLPIFLDQVGNQLDKQIDRLRPPSSPPPAVKINADVIAEIDATGTRINDLAKSLNKFLETDNGKKTKVSAIELKVAPNEIGAQLPVNPK